MCDGRLGSIDIAKHRIQLSTTDVRPINFAPYHAGPKAHEFDKTDIDKVLCMEIIGPARSEWASAIVFTQKEDGSLHFCINYGKLNAMTVKEAYPMKHMEEFLDL